MISGHSFVDGKHPMIMKTPDRTWIHNDPVCKNCGLRWSHYVEAMFHDRTITCTGPAEQLVFADLISTPTAQKTKARVRDGSSYWLEEWERVIDPL